MYSQLINQYWEENNSEHVPENIIIFKDNIDKLFDEGNAFLYTDIAQMNSVFAEISPVYKPKLAIITVTKKVVQKFFQYQLAPTMSWEEVKIANPEIGTVISNPHSEKFDYYICSQSVKAGVITPTYYHVIFNSTEYSEEQFWTISFYQCWNYLNWSGIICYPAPMQYARKLANFAADIQLEQPHPNLEKTFYYL